MESFNYAEKEGGDPFTPRKSLARSPPPRDTRPEVVVVDDEVRRTASGLFGGCEPGGECAEIIKEKTSVESGGGTENKKEKQNLTTNEAASKATTSRSRAVDTAAVLKRRPKISGDDSDGSAKENKEIKTKKEVFKQPKRPVRKKINSVTRPPSDNTEGECAEEVPGAEGGGTFPPLQGRDRAKGIAALMNTFAQLAVALLPEREGEKAALIEDMVNRVRDIILGTTKNDQCDAIPEEPLQIDGKVGKRKCDFTSPPFMGMAPKRKQNLRTDTTMSNVDAGTRTTTTRGRRSGA